MHQRKQPLESSWISHVTLGSNDPAGTAAYLSAFGHDSFAAPDLSADAAKSLYQRDTRARQIIMKPSDLAGEIRIVETGVKPSPLEPFQLGIHGIDFYTTDLAHSRDVASAAGGLPSLNVPYASRNVTITESRVLSADQDYAIFISEVDNRPFPSALDAQPERQFSDQVTVVVFVDENDVDAEIEFWTEKAGLELFRKDLEFDDDAMQSLMDLPHKARMGAVQFCDRGRRRRLELLFYKETKGPRPDAAGLRPGFHSIGFPVKDIDEAISAFDGVAFSTPVVVDFGKGPSRAATARSPAGIHFELFEARR